MPEPRNRKYLFPVVGYRGRVGLHWGEDAGAADLFAEVGTPIQAMTDGTVVSAGWSDIGGWNVTLQGDDGLTYYMAHMYDKPLVGQGQRVAAGTQLGGVGDTGNAKGTGTHLHIGIGPEIQRGTGPRGGSGANFNANQFLTDALAGADGGSMPETFSSNNAMADLVYKKAKAYAIAQGSSEQEADVYAKTMIAIAYGESDLKPGAIRDTRTRPDELVLSGRAQPEYSVGLFQANMQGGRGSASGYSDQQILADPNLQIDIANGYLYEQFKSQGGLSGFQQNPVSFVSRVYQVGQGSITPDPGKIQTALGSIALGVDTTGMSPQSSVPGTSTLPPPASRGDAIQSVLEQRVTEAASDPNRAYELPQLINGLQSIRALNGEIDPTTMAGLQADSILAARNNVAAKDRLLTEIAAQAGLKEQDIQGQLTILHARQAFEADQAALDRAETARQQGADLAVTQERLALDRQIWQGQYGISQGELDLARERFGFDREMGREEIGLRREDMALQRELGMGALDIDRQRLAIDQQAALREEKKAVLAGMVDLIGAQVQAETLTARQAEAALDALVKVYTETGGGQEFMPGFEPGGAYATMLGAIGGVYNPSYYRIRAFPLDLQSMAKMGGQFDMSKAWKTAQEMMASSGFTPPQSAPGQQSAQPASGGVPMPGNVPPTQPAAPMQAPQTSPMPQPGMPPVGPMPTQPQFTPPAVSAPAGPMGGSVNATPPSQGAGQPCPPGHQKAWNGTSYMCVPSPQEQAKAPIGPQPVPGVQ